MKCYENYTLVNGDCVLPPNAPTKKLPITLIIVVVSAAVLLITIAVVVIVASKKKKKKEQQRKQIRVQQITKSDIKRSSDS